MINNDPSSAREMEDEMIGRYHSGGSGGPSFNGYELLSHILYCHRNIIDNRVQEIVFELVGISSPPKSSDSQSQQPSQPPQPVTRQPSTSLLPQLNRRTSDTFKRSHTAILSKKEKEELRSRQFFTSTTSGEMRRGFNGVVANPSAFKYILLNCDLWTTSLDMQQTLFQRIKNLISARNEHHKFNLRRMREVNVITSLLGVICDTNASLEILPPISEIITNIMQADLDKSVYDLRVSPPSLSSL